MSFLYGVNVAEVRVPDGDTISSVHLDYGLDLAGFQDQDLGDYVEVHEGRLRRRKRIVRLNGVDAPEVHGKTKRERDAAQRARSWLTGELKAATEAVTVESMEKPDKFGRFLGRVRVGARDLNQELIDRGLAHPYDGGKKQPW